jgi:hypothetical protein
MLTIKINDDRTGRRLVDPVDHVGKMVGGSPYINSEVR